METVCSFQVCSARFFCRALLLLLVVSVSAPVFSQAGKKKNRQASILFNTASRLYRQKNWRDAAATFGDFIKRYPKHEDAMESHFARGYCFNRLDRTTPGHRKSPAAMDMAMSQLERPAKNSSKTCLPKSPGRPAHHPAPRPGRRDPRRRTAAHRGSAGRTGRPPAGGCRGAGRRNHRKAAA